MLSCSIESRLKNQIKLQYIYLRPKINLNRIEFVSFHFSQRWLYYTDLDGVAEMKLILVWFSFCSIWWK